MGNATSPWAKGVESGIPVMVAVTAGPYEDGKNARWHLSERVTT